MIQTYSRTNAGTAVADITPPPRSDMAGSFTRNISTGIGAPLKSRAMVLASRGKKLVFCAVDLATVSDETVTRVRERVAKELGINAESVMIGATHTHNGPVVQRAHPDSEQVKAGYADYLENQIFASIEQAHKALVPARIGIAVGEEPSLVFNRRLRRPDGRIAMNFAGKSGLTDCIGDGPVDPHLFVIRAEDLDGNPLGVLFNYPLHNNAVGGKDIHPDISGFVEQTMQARLQADIPVLFFAGPSGDINWIDYRDMNQTGGYADARRIADKLAGTLGELYDTVTLQDDILIDCASARITLQERELQPVDFTDDGCFGDELGPIFAASYANVRSKLEHVTEWNAFSYELSAFRIGGTIWISNPGELFVELGLEIKRLSPFGPQRTCVCTLTNGFAGYIPTPKSFEEGGYEVRRTTFSSILEVEAGPKMVRQSLELCRMLAD